MNNPYDFFDEIVCINLKSRMDKRSHSEKVFSELNIPATFYNPNKSPYGGLYGCFQSHINVIRKAYHNGSNNVLIFEDDVIPSVFYSEDVINKCIDFMKNNNWNLFYLGYTCSIKSILMPKKINELIYKSNVHCCHAYIVNRNSMKNIINKADYYIKNPNIKKHIDFFLAEMYDIYYPIKNQFTQNRCLGTDNNYNFYNINYNNIVDKLNCIIQTQYQLDTNLVYYINEIKLIIFIIILLLIIKYK